MKPLTVLVALCALLSTEMVAGCGGDADRDDHTPDRPVGGTFVGRVAGTNAFVAVVASPAARGRDRGAVRVYVSDGRRFSESLTGSVLRNGFTATSEDRDTEAEGTLSRAAVSGTVQLPNGKAARYRATRATGPAGLYKLTISARGKLSGASATGVALTGETALRTGLIRLADGKRRKFDVTGGLADETARLRAGQVRLIILRGGELRGAGQRGTTSSDGDPGFFIRSSS